MEKLQSTAKGLDIVFKILSIFTIIGIVILLAINVAGFAVGYDKLTAADSTSIMMTIGGVHIDAKDLGTPLQIGRFILLISASAAIGLAALWYGFRIVRRILAPMKEGQPFSRGISADFKKLGWFVIVCGIAYNVFDLFAKSMLAMQLVTAQPDGPVTMGIEHHLDLTFIIIAFVFFLCSYIFRYGEELQVLSDETI